jgi:hypothetical protein
MSGGGRTPLIAGHRITRVHTTPPSPIDVPSEVPAVAPHARTTVRLHPRPGTPAIEQSSVGGPLQQPGGPAAPLVPVVQLLADDVPELPFPDGTDVLQVLWCPFDHDPFSAPRPQVRWRRRAGLGACRSSMPSPDAESDPRLVPSPCVVDPERVVEYPIYDLPEGAWSRIREAVRRVARETGWEYERDPLCQGRVGHVVGVRSEPTAGRDRMIDFRDLDLR